MSCFSVAFMVNLILAQQQFPKSLPGAVAVKVNLTSKLVSEIKVSKRGTRAKVPRW
jgi:hypothetical protein